MGVAMKSKIEMRTLCCAAMIAYCVVNMPSTFAAETKHPLLANSGNLSQAMVGTRQHAEQCGASGDSNVAARLEVANEQPLVLRVGIECIGSFEWILGNIWLDPERSISMAVASFEPFKESLEGYLSQPVNRHKTIERSEATYLLDGVSVGRLVRVSQKTLPTGISPVLLAGEHILQLSVSARIRDDSQAGRDSAKLTSFADGLDTVHCRSEPCRVRVPSADVSIEQEANTQQIAESPLKCILRPLGLLPRKVGDSVTFELILENNSKVTQILDASVLACGVGFNGVMLLTKEVAGATPNHWDLIQPGRSRFKKLSQGSTERLFSQVCTHQIKVPPDCFVASKLHIPRWEIPGEFSLQVIYHRRVFNQDRDDRIERLDAPKSNKLRFAVIE
ncbi:MAG: hypothetical protein NTZ32_26565 [Planctomycetales bacterium]|nr:hypothetical protein [Planctomycetales bacterium]